jgi:hypothetical protein
LFWINVKNHLIGKDGSGTNGRGYGCSFCSQYKTEKWIGETLANQLPEDTVINHNFCIPVIKNTRKCRVDFHFTIDQVEYFIEVNGAQHYTPTRFGLSPSNADLEATFVIQRERDEKVKDYCKQIGCFTIIDGRKIKTQDHAKIEIDKRLKQWKIIK